MIRHRFLIAVIVLTLGVILLGCTPKATPSGKESALTTVAGARTAVVGASQSAVPAKGQTAVASGFPSAVPARGQTAPAGEEGYSFDEVRQLDKLNSYRGKLTWSYKTGTEDVNSAEATSEYVKQPPAWREAVQFSRGGKPYGDPYETIRIGDVMYSRVGQEWLVMQQQSQDNKPPMSALLAPELYFGNEKGKLVGRETVNGMATKHYRYEVSALNPLLRLSKLTEYRSDVWVSDEFKVYVKATMHMVGVDDKNITQSYDWESLILDINKPITIKPPEGAQALSMPDDIPLMEKSVVDTIMSLGKGSLNINITAPKPLADVTKFYQEQMKAKGWTVGQSAGPLTTYTKGKRTAQVVLADKGGQTEVTVMITDEGVQDAAAPTRPAATRVVSPTGPVQSRTTVAKQAPTETPAPNLIAGIPLISGAADVNKGEDYITFAAKQEIKDVAQYYKQALSAGGWKLEEEQDEGEDEGRVITQVFRHTKDKRVATITIEGGEETRNVSIYVVQE